MQREGRESLGLIKKRSERLGSKLASLAEVLCWASDICSGYDVHIDEVENDKISQYKSTLTSRHEENPHGQLHNDHIILSNSAKKTCVNDDSVVVKDQERAFRKTLGGVDETVPKTPFQVSLGGQEKASLTKHPLQCQEDTVGDDVLSFAVSGRTNISEECITEDSKQHPWQYTSIQNASCMIADKPCDIERSQSFEIVGEASEELLSIGKVIGSNFQTIQQEQDEELHRSVPNSLFELQEENNNWTNDELEENRDFHSEVQAVQERNALTHQEDLFDVTKDLEPTKESRIILEDKLQEDNVLMSFVPESLHLEIENIRTEKEDFRMSNCKVWCKHAEIFEEPVVEMERLDVSDLTFHKDIFESTIESGYSLCCKSDFSVSDKESLVESVGLVSGGSINESFGNTTINVYNCKSEHTVCTMDCTENPIQGKEMFENKESRGKLTETTPLTFMYFLGTLLMVHLYILCNSYDILRSSTKRAKRSTDRLRRRVQRYFLRKNRRHLRRICRRFSPSLGNLSNVVKTCPLQRDGRQPSNVNREEIPHASSSIDGSVYSMSVIDSGAPVSQVQRDSGVTVPLIQGTVLPGTEVGPSFISRQTSRDGPSDSESSQQTSSLGSFNFSVQQTNGSASTIPQPSYPFNSNLSAQSGSSELNNFSGQFTNGSSSSGASDTTIFSSSLGATSSLDSFFSDVNNGANEEQLMHYQWTRVTSFALFPLACGMSTTRLAREGWYYLGSGEGDLTKCFSCGVVHQGWQRGEDPRAYHNPNCR